eukprot:gene10816-13250_t
MSQDLIWNVIRKNHAFKVERNGVVFSSEPGNLRNKHSLKYSGLARKTTIDVAPTADGKIVVSNKVQKKAANPSKSLNKVTFSHHNYRKTARYIRGLATGYSPELRAAALGRFHRIQATLKNQRFAKTKATKTA